jgi:hypothetical protein
MVTVSVAEVADAPDTQLADKGLKTCTLVQEMFPILMVIPLTKPVPTIVIVVPPAFGPLAGEMEATVKSLSDLSCFAPISWALVQDERATAMTKLKAT